MTRPRRLLAAGALLLLLPAGLARADTVRYRLGPAQGTLSFKATSRLVDADGRFHRFSGEVRVDPNALDQAVVTLVVEAASVDTGIRRRAITSRARTSSKRSASPTSRSPAAGSLPRTARSSSPATSPSTA